MVVVSKWLFINIVSISACHAGNRFSLAPADLPRPRHTAALGIFSERRGVAVKLTARGAPKGAVQGTGCSIPGMRRSTVLTLLLVLPFRLCGGFGGFSHSWLHHGSAMDSPRHHHGPATEAPWKYHEGTIVPPWKYRGPTSAAFDSGPIKASTVDAPRTRESAIDPSRKRDLSSTDHHGPTLKAPRNHHEKTMGSPWAHHRSTMEGLWTPNNGGIMDAPCQHHGGTLDSPRTAMKAPGTRNGDTRGPTWTHHGTIDAPR